MPVSFLDFALNIYIFPLENMILILVKSGL